MKNLNPVSIVYYLYLVSTVLVLPAIIGLGLAVVFRFTANPQDAQHHSEQIAMGAKWLALTLGAYIAGILIAAMYENRMFTMVTYLPTVFLALKAWAGLKFHAATQPATAPTISDL